jgi:hypothetical protein
MQSFNERAQQETRDENGQHLVGMNYYTVGLDARCNKVVHKVMFYEKKTVGIAIPTFDGRYMQQDCVVLSEGIKVISDSNTLYDNKSEVPLGEK